MPFAVDFKSVSVEGLETSDLPEPLAGLRANEARYFHTKYKHAFCPPRGTHPKCSREWNKSFAKNEESWWLRPPSK